MADRTWIHAFTDGRDVSPHAAADDLARLPAEEIATVVGRYYAMDRDNRAERTERAVAAILDGEGEAGGRPGRRRVARATSAAHRRVHRADRVPGLPAARSRASTPPIFFNFRPDRGRQLSRRLLERGVDLTTMTRYAEDIPTPVAFPEQDVARHARRGAERRRHRGSSTRPRPRSTPTSPTSSTAARRRSGRARRACSSPRRAMCRATTSKPEMSAAGVAAEVVAAAARRIRLLRRQLRESRHGRPHRRDPGRRPRRRGGRRGARASRRGDGRARWRLPRHRRPRQRRADARGGRRQPAHGPHDQSRPTRRSRRAGARASRRRQPRRPRSDGPRTARTSRSRGDDGTESLVVNPRTMGIADISATRK